MCIRDSRGGTQGALTTPPHSLYTLPLQNAIESSETKIEIEGIKVNTSATADDQVNAAKSKTDFMVLSDLYEWYHKIFKLSFGWEKTVSLWCTKPKRPYGRHNIWWMCLKGYRTFYSPRYRMP